jgi:prephenate dehydratase
VRAGYFGPPGTFTHEALIGTAAGDPALELVPLPSIQDLVFAVRDGELERALVPIENSIEGAVNATMDALAGEASDVSILGEVVIPITQCLIARGPLALEQIEVVASHPQATGQCRGFLRTQLPQARVETASSTAEAVRIVAGHDGPWAALGNRLAAKLYDAQILQAGVEDVAGNETRFVWLGSIDSPPGLPGPASVAAQPWKTAIVFWGAGSEAAGWLVRCLSELAVRGVNMTRIESRPRKHALGRYKFFIDLDGASTDATVAEALDALREHVAVLRVLGSFPAA